jgi:cephalosporin-C deacetylase-like acetyl esterase
MNKVVFSAFAVMTAVALSANPLKGWSPTNGNQLKTNLGSVKVDGTSITLKGNKSGAWYYFFATGKKGVKGQQIQFTLTASGKGKVDIGCYEYKSGFNLSAQQSKALKLTDTPQEIKVVLPVKSDDTTIIRPRLTMYAGSEIKITKFECEITGKPAPKFDAVVNADRPDFMYKVGETAHFTVEPKLDGKVITEGTVTIYPIYNGFPKANLKFDLAKGPVKFDATMDKPGFYRAHIAIQDKTGKFILKRQHSANVAAAFSPEEIKAGRPAPKDLITYWYGQYEKLNKEVPANFKVEAQYENGAHSVQRITFDNFGGTKSYCTITIPLNKKGPLPMVFTVPPAGNYGWGTFKRSNAIQVTITVFDRLFPKHADYMTFNKPWYYLKGAQSRETYYYYKAILGMMRMMDYSMKNVKEWDGKHLAAVGRSQGGGSAFILAALNPKIQCVSADVPALCDHNAYDAGRRAGWPQVLRSAPNRSKTFDKDAEYFDAANFAAFVKCPALVTVGFYDSMCEPMSVYAAYNNLKGEKKMLNYPRYGHGWGKRDEGELNRETEKLLNAVFAK